MRGIAKSLTLLSLAASLGMAPAQAAECGLKRITSVDTVAGQNGMMLVPVKFGEAERLLLFDTGGSISGVTESAAQDLGLNSREGGVPLIGVGGAVSRRYTVVPSLTVGTLQDKSIKFMILPVPAMSPDNHLAGSLAPNPNVDLDLDFAGRKLSFFSNDHCAGQVVYWPAKAVAAVPMRVAGLGHIIIPVTLDGKRLDALVDTGASNTFLNMDVAESRFGVRLDSPDVELVGGLTQSPSMKVYRRQFATLSFEGVTVANPVIMLIPDRMSVRMPNTPRTGSLISEARRGLPDIALGMSVLGKMHMYVAYRERKVYITAATPQGSP